MVVVVVDILLPDFIQLQITSNGNKTANIYVKTVQFIYSVERNRFSKNRNRFPFRVEFSAID